MSFEKNETNKKNETLNYDQVGLSKLIHKYNSININEISSNRSKEITQLKKDVFELFENELVPFDLQVILEENQFREAQSQEPISDSVQKSDLIKLSSITQYLSTKPYDDLFDMSVTDEKYAGIAIREIIRELSEEEIQIEDYLENKDKKENISIEAEAKKTLINSYKFYNDIQNIINGKAENNEILMGEKVLDLVEEIELKPYDFKSESTRLLSSRNKSVEVFSLLLTKQNSSLVGSKENVQSIIEKFIAVIKDLEISKLAPSYVSMTSEEKEEFLKKLQPKGSKSLDRNFRKVIDIVKNKLKQHDRTVQLQELFEKNKDQFEKGQAYSSLDLEKALVLIEKEFLELNERKEELYVDIINEYKEIFSNHGVKEAKLFIINTICNIKGPFGIESKNYHQHKILEKYINSIDIDFYEHDKIKQIAGDSVQRIAVYFQNPKFYEELAGEKSGGFSTNFLYQSEMLRYFVSKYKKEEYEEVALHEMLHSVDPYVDTRKGPDGVLTELMAYTGMYDELRKDDVRKYLVSDLYEPKYGIKEIPSEYAIIVDTVVEHTERLIEKYGHTDTVRIIGMSQTIEEFLEKT